MVALPSQPEVPASLRKDLSQVDASLYTAVSVWLKKHGKGIKPKLSDEQKQQLKECFELMDQDGSGAIDADELGAAFKLLGIRMKKAELEALLAEVDHDGSGEVEYPEFLEIMTVTLQRLAEEEDSDKNEGQVPFALMATAYRRKRLMEGIIQGDKEVQAQIQQISDKANLEALRQTKAAEIENMKGKGEGMLAHRQGGSCPRPGKNLKRIGQLSIDQQIMSTLSPEERRIVGSLSGKHALAKAPPPPVNLAGTTRPYQHFTDSPTHKQLVETPTLLDVKFLHRPSIKLPPAVSSAMRTRSMTGWVDGSGMASPTARGVAPSPGRGLRSDGSGSMADPRQDATSFRYPSPKQPAGRVLSGEGPRVPGLRR